MPEITIHPDKPLEVDGQEVKCWRLVTFSRSYTRDFEKLRSAVRAGCEHFRGGGPYNQMWIEAVFENGESVVCFSGSQILTTNANLFND